VTTVVYNPFDPAEIIDPYDTYHRLVTEAPVLPSLAFPQAEQEVPD
jgi:hypothetical protein